MSSQSPKRDNPPTAFESAALRLKPSLAGEIWGFLKENKKWWLLPIIISCVVIGLLLLVGTTGVAPFIYTLF